MPAQVLSVGHMFTVEVVDRPNSDPVVLKYPTASSPSSRAVEVLERELEIGSSLNIRGVRNVLCGTEWNGRPALELEHIDGETFASHFQVEQHRQLKDVLRLATSVATTLDALHAAGVVHRDVAATNLLVSKDGERAVVIDLGFATRTGSNDPPAYATGGHLPYLPPEQTGRIDLPVDERSDLYSFGVVLYEMLTGSLPFQAEDRSGWIHSHLARLPEPPSQRRPDVPRVVSDIVLRLLAKTPDNRYQTARGLAHDLQHCLTTLEQSGAVPDFPLGRDDLSGRLRSPQVLYGREEEQERLATALERAFHGEPGLLLVSGFAGVGKTALVNGLRFPVAIHGAHFVAGKFDQTLHAIPYSAFAEAFTQLCEQVLAGAPEELASFRARVLESLGKNAGLLLELIPELENVIGPQPRPPPLETAESANRFAMVLLGFFHCMVTPEQPLILFLDDVQWADTASLDLLHLLVTRTVRSHFLIVCAYRDNEIEDGHPLLALVERLRSEWQHVSHMALRGLTVDQSSGLVAETLGVSLQEAKPLAALIHQKTDGNPFFLRQVLEALVHDGALRFDTEAGAWSWEAARVNAQDISDNVIELMLRKIARLPRPTRELLQVAACIGNTFSFDLLSAASGQTEERVLGSSLAPAAKAGLLALLERSARFTHDRIQQAVYESLGPHEAQRIHLGIGRHLAAQQRSRELLLATVQQLNLGSPLIETREESVELARMNLEAGHAAKAAMAYAGAADFYRKGKALLDVLEVPEPSLRFELSLHAAETEFFVGNVASSVQRLRRLLGDAPDLSARTRVYEILIDIDTVELKVAAALKTGMEALADIGIDLPDDQPAEALVTGVAEINELLAQRGTEELDTWPTMSDPLDLAAVALLAHVSPPAYISSDPRFPLIAVEFARRALRGGLSRFSSSALAVYGLLVSVALHRVEDARKIGRLALAISQRADNATTRARVNFFHAAFIEHWCAPLESTLPYFDAGWRAGIEDGDLQFASYCLNHLHGNGLLAGQPLPELEQSFTQLADVDHIIRQESGQHVFSMVRRAVEALRHTTGELPDLAVDHGGQAAVSLWRETGNATTLSLYYLLNCLLATTLARPREALAAAENAAPVLAGVFGMTWIPHHHYLHALALCSAARLGEVERQAALQQIGAFHDDLEKWAEHSPDNYLPKALLVEAELRDLAGEAPGMLVDAYDASIDAAVSAGRTFDHGIACERAAGCWLGHGKERIAGAYLQEALEVYRTWGADAKVDQLLRDHASLLTGSRPRGSTSSSGSSSDELRSSDVDSVLKAAQTVAGELVLDRMLARLIGLVIETAGAQSGFLLLIKDGVWCVVAEQRVDREGVEVLQWRPLDRYTDIAAAVVQYVARTKEPVNIADASKSTLFAADSSIVARECRSILCLPIINRGELGGILYLENNLSPRAFTRTHTRILQLLANQALSSLEISRYYARVQTLEEQLMQAQKLESVGRLAGGIAHDINNSLAPILGYAELLQLNTPESDARRADIGEIIRCAKHARDTTRQMLAFARKQPLEVKPLDLNAVLGTLERMLRRTIREDIAIETEFGLGLGSVIGDSALIEQAVLNLAVNAQDAMPEGGRLTIRTALSNIDEHVAQTHEGAAPGAYALLSVSDSGVGMDESTRARIFEPFFTTKELGKGTGLGLSMVYGVVKQHGGFVEVESAPGKGTEFSLYFPATRNARASVEAAARGEVPSGDEVVLVVEDQEVVLALVARMLSSQGYKVLTALTGADALSQVAAYEGTIHLLITDVIMPGMNGRELHEALQGTCPGLEVIYMSGYPADVISSRTDLPSGTHFLQKPVPLATLLGKVRAVLDG